MKSWLIPMAAGFGAGILSAWGVGGGTLLLLVMTLILGVPQQQAAAVNLLYFLPTAAMGVIAHKRNGLLETEVLKSAIPWGTTAAASLRLAAPSSSCITRPMAVPCIMAVLWTIWRRNTSLTLSKILNPAA